MRGSANAVAVGEYRADVLDFEYGAKCLGTSLGFICKFTYKSKICT